jgi:hypothetical protein
MKHNSNFKYDLEVGKKGENLVAKMLSKKKVEVKYDQRAVETGNIFVEISSRGKPSGIYTTESDYFIYVLNGTNSMLVFETPRFRYLIEKLKEKAWIIRGGDCNTSEGLLLKLNKIKQYNEIMQEYKL